MSALNSNFPKKPNKFHGWGKRLEKEQDSFWLVPALEKNIWYHTLNKGLTQQLVIKSTHFGPL